MDKSIQDKSGFEHSKPASSMLDARFSTPAQAEAFYEELRRSKRATLPDVSGEFFLLGNKVCYRRWRASR